MSCAMSLLDRVVSMLVWWKFQIVLWVRHKIPSKSLEWSEVGLWGGDLTMGVRCSSVGESINMLTCLRRWT